MEPVTLKSRGYTADDTATYTDYSIEKAKKRPPSGDEASQDGFATSGFPDALWQIWSEHLESAVGPNDTVGAPNPKIGDVIVQADGTRWSVARVEVRLFDNVHNLLCHREPR